jgi:5'-3' exoribonuclease 1
MCIRRFCRAWVSALSHVSSTCIQDVSDGYINESGTINTKRLQVVIDEMALWEQEVFEKEYGDMNWYKGKQAKHVKEMELGRKRSKLGLSLCLIAHSLLYFNLTPPLVLTRPQREIFNKVKQFVMENRSAPSTSHLRAARLAMRNDFPARERAFIGTLAQDLHLTIRWDEYDDEDENLVTWGFVRATTASVPASGEGTPLGNENVDGKASGDEGDGEWEDVEDGDDDNDDDIEDEESRAAVDRVLNKYEKAQVVDDDQDGGFDARHERSVKEKMDEWKRGYYKVCLSFTFGANQGMREVTFEVH